MKKYTIKEFAEGKKAVKIENEEQWNKLNKVYELTSQYHGVWEYGNKQGYSKTPNWYISNGWEVLEFSQLNFKDEFVEGWYKNKISKSLYRNILRNEVIWSSHLFEKDYNVKENFSDWKLLTDLSEIQQYLPKNHPDLIKKDTFVLPEKWYVKITEENRNQLNDWKVNQEYKDNLFVYKNYGYLAEDGAGICTLMMGIPIITFEQFKTHVLKESTMEEIKVGSQFKVSGESANTIYTFNRIEGDDVDVAWGIIHHVHYYLSTCLANIKDGSWILVNKEKTMEKEILGYKLIKPEYEKATIKLLGWNFTTKLLINISEKGDIHRLKEAGVLDLWFEKVYKEEFKVGDWISFSNATKTKTITSKLKEWTAHNYCILENGEKPFKDIIRKSTPEEIKTAQIQLPTINGYTGKMEDDFIIYGSNCARFHKDFFIDLSSIYNLDGNRCLKSIKLSSDVEITIEEIKQIVEYINNK